MNPSAPPSDKTPASLLRTGVPGLEDVLGGGLTPGRLYLVEGTPGSGKTTIAMQFLMEGVRLGEAVLYVTLSETSDELQGVAQSHGWDLKGMEVREMLPSQDSLSPEEQYTVFHPSEVELGETTIRILKEVERINPSRVVFDSLSELRLLAGNSLRYRRQILALKQPFGADTAQRTAALVDGWAARWRATRIEACRAHQRGEQSATIFDRRMACLDAELATAGEVLDRMAAGGPAAVRNAFTAIAALPAPEACAADRLQQAMPLPYDPRVAAIAADRAAAQAAIAVADVPEARRRIVAALAAAEALDHPGVLAQVLLDGAAIGVAEDPRAALAALERALTLATAAGDPDLQAVATLRLLDDATTRNDAKAAESLLPVARAAVARPGVPRTVGNDFVESEALALIAIGRFDEALAACAQIAAAEPPPQVRATQCRCGAYVTMSDYDGAELHCTAALAAAEQHFGATHPAITSRLGQLVKAYRLRGRGEAALALAERALTIDEAAYGPESFAVSADLCSKGSALTEVQRLAEAQLAVERCLAIRTRLDGAGPPSRGAGEAEQQLAEILVAAGNVDEGLVRADRALAIFEQTIAPETPEMVWAYATHGNLSVAGDRWASVERSMGRCIELALQVHGANHPLRVMCLLGLAQALIAADRAADAVPNARQGLDALIAMRAAPYNIAVAHGVLGAALGRSGDRRGARRQLDEAIALFDSLGAAGADGAAEAREQRAQF